MAQRLVLGIRKELKNKWERRVPLVPAAVKKLTLEGTTVLVQPSRNRIFPNESFKQAGAIITDDLSNADVILGVKEVPISQLMPNKTYMFFSHTHKGQPHNMPMLKNILDKKIRLMDYELLKDKNSIRLVQFSKFAGYAGMIDGLHSLGIRLLGLGMASPFLAIGMSYMYRNLGDARLDVMRSGMVIRDDGFPKELGPMTFIFTGGGNVTQGAIHVFKSLPYEWVSPNDLKSLYESDSYDKHKVYGCQVLPEDYLQRVDGGSFDRNEYISRPELYKSVFSQKIAPYSRFILNGIFWDSKYPRLLTNEEVKTLAQSNRLPLLTLSDVSCDINGSMEFMTKASTIDDPFYMYDPITKTTHSDPDGSGIQIMSIDNLPSEMPLEASEYFSESLYPFVSELVKGNYDHPVLKGAIITTADGQLSKPHIKLYDSIKKVLGKSKKNIAILGSGYVVGPVVDYLLKIPEFHITIASDKLDEAIKLANGRDRIRARSLDVNNSNDLSALIAKHDLIISLIPASLHHIVAEKCIDQKKNMVTASYINESLAALNKRAENAGITIMNEVGLDPGIDHLTALSIFKKVRSEGGHITEFISWCGGLPAPEASGNPLGYKFSWSPQGVLAATSNPGKYLKDSQVVKVEGSDLLKSAVDVPIMKGFAIEGYPNRDSLKYISLYKLDSTKLQTMFRGTLRYKGFSSLMDALKEIGLLSPSKLPNDKRESWNTLLGHLLNGKLTYKNDQLGLLARKLNLKTDHPKVFETWNALKWIGMFSTEKLDFGAAQTFLDLFSRLLQDKLKYIPGERDMVIMHHIFGISTQTGACGKLSSTMIAYGDPNGYTAMAKTVGLPTAIAAEMILNGQIKEKGVIAPMNPDVYEPMLKKLESEGIKFVEKYDNL